MFGVWEPSGVPKMFKMKRDTGLFMQIYTNFKKPLICICCWLWNCCIIQLFIYILITLHMLLRDLTVDFYLFLSPHDVKLSLSLSLILIPLIAEITDIIFCPAFESICLNIQISLWM